MRGSRTRIVAPIASLAFLTFLTFPAGVAAAEEPASAWTARELRLMRSISIDALGAPPFDPSNRVADDEAAARLGRRLFFDARLSRDGSVACTTCHDPARAFTDARPRSHGLGITRRHAQTLVGAQYGGWFYWDGRRDSAWAQALVPLEHPDEMGGGRLRVARVAAFDPVYRAAWETVFGELPALGDPETLPAAGGPLGGPEDRKAWEALPAERRDAVDRLFAQAGKALAAYERKLVPGPSRFDRYARRLLAPAPAGDAEAGSAAGAGGKSRLGPREQAGLRLFLSDRAQCLRCHNGPLMTNFGFHNTGVPNVDPPDAGRHAGVREALDDPFNCRGPFSDAAPGQCAELEFAKLDGEELPGAFKVPTLRNVARTAPYMERGQLATLERVLMHYSRPPRDGLGHQELVAVHFTPEELRALEAFLRTLDSPLAEPEWGRPPADLPRAGTPASPSP